MASMNRNIYAGQHGASVNLAGYRFFWLCDSPLLLPLWQKQTPSPSMLLLSVLGVCVPHVDSCPPVPKAYTWA